MQRNFSLMAKFLFDNYGAKSIIQRAFSEKAAGRSYFGTANAVAVFTNFPIDSFLTSKHIHKRRWFALRPAKGGQMIRSQGKYFSQDEIYRIVMLLRESEM